MKKPKIRYLYYAPTKGHEGYIYDREYSVVIDHLDEKKRPLNNITKELNRLHAENLRLKEWNNRFYACLKQNEENGVWFSATMEYEKKILKSNEQS